MPQEPHAMQCEFLNEQHAALHRASCAWNFQGARLDSQHPSALATAQINMLFLAMKKFLMRCSVVESLCRIAMQCEFLSEQHATLHAASCAWNFQGARLYSQHPYAVATAQINMSILAMKKFLMRRSVVASLCRIVCE